MGPDFEEFTTIHGLPTGDNRGMYTVGVINDYGRFLENKCLAYVECEGELVAKQEFTIEELKDFPDLISNWTQSIRQAHKKECPHMIVEEACGHVSDETYAIQIDDRRAFACRECLTDFIFRFSARGPLTVNRINLNLQPK